MQNYNTADTQTGNKPPDTTPANHTNGLHYNYAPSGGTFAVLSSGNSELHANVLTQVHKKINTPFFHCKPNSREQGFDIAIEWGSRLGAYALSPAAVVFYLLSLQEENLPGGAARQPFALAAFAANAAQISVAGEITFKRHLDYLKQAIIKISEISSMSTEARRRFFQDNKMQHFIHSLKFTIPFGIKWTLVYFVSMMAPSLALQAGIDNDAMLNYIHVAIMAMLEPSIFDRLNDLALPRFTIHQIVEHEREQFRQAYYQILHLNANTAKNELQAAHSQELLKLIIDEDHLALFSTILAPAHAHEDVLLSDARSILGVMLTLFLATAYFMSNTGAYIETRENPNASILSQYGSILGDTCFGIFMSIRGGKALADLFGYVSTFIRTQPRKAVITLLSTLVAALTVGSTLAPNQKANMPTLVLIGGVLGTIFDNAYFLAEEIGGLESSLALHDKNREGGRYQRAVIGYFYNQLQDTYEHKTNVQFLNVIFNILQTDPCFLDAYKYFLHKKLPWAENLSVFQMVDTLRKPPTDAIKVIDRLERFGVKRHRAEILGSTVAMLIVGLSLIPTTQATATLFFQYLNPVIAVPVGLGTTGLFSHCRRKRDNEAMPLLGANSSSLASSSPPTLETDHPNQIITFSNVIKSAIATALPLVIKLGIKAPLLWISSNILMLAPDDAELLSENGATMLSMVGAQATTNYLAVKMR